MHRVIHSHTHTLTHSFWYSFVVEGGAAVVRGRRGSCWLLLCLGFLPFVRFAVRQAGEGRGAES